MGLDKTGDFYLVDLFGGGSRGEAEDFLWPCEWRGLGWLGLGVYRASQLKRFAAAEAEAHCLLLPLTPFSVGSNPSPRLSDISHLIWCPGPYVGFAVAEITAKHNFTAGPASEQHSLLFREGVDKE